MKYIDTDTIAEIESILMRCLPYIALLNAEAEAKHDDMLSEYYMDSVQYEIMQNTEKLISDISDILGVE